MSSLYEYSRKIAIRYLVTGLILTVSAIILSLYLIYEYNYSKRLTIDIHKVLIEKNSTYEEYVGDIKFSVSTIKYFIYYESDGSIVETYILLIPKEGNPLTYRLLLENYRNSSGILDVNTEVQKVYIIIKNVGNEDSIVLLKGFLIFSKRVSDFIYLLTMVSIILGLAGATLLVRGTIFFAISLGLKKRKERELRKFPKLLE